MNVADARGLVLELLQQVAPDADLVAIDPDRDLRRAIDLDSLDFQTLVERVAERTGVEIPEVDYPQVRSLRGISEYLAVRMS